MASVGMAWQPPAGGGVSTVGNRSPRPQSPRVRSPGAGLLALSGLWTTTALTSTCPAASRGTPSQHPQGRSPEFLTHRNLVR